MSLTFNVQIDTTNAVKEDQEGARYAVELENVRRANQDPPEPALPTSPNSELFNSYVTVWNTQTTVNTHEGYVGNSATKTHRERRIAYDAADEATQQAVDDLLFPSGG